MVKRRSGKKRSKSRKTKQGQGKRYRRQGDSESASQRRRQKSIQSSGSSQEYKNHLRSRHDHEFFQGGSQIKSDFNEKAHFQYLHEQRRQKRRDNGNNLVNFGDYRREKQQLPSETESERPNKRASNTYYKEMRQQKAHLEQFIGEDSYFKPEDLHRPKRSAKKHQTYYEDDSYVYREEQDSEIHHQIDKNLSKSRASVFKLNMPNASRIGDGQSRIIGSKDDDMDTMRRAQRRIFDGE
jgi:hypothetical protein